MKTKNFSLPKTAMAIVVWFRTGEKHETLIPTPPNNIRLTEFMFSKHHVGVSEIRAIKAVDPLNLIGNAF